MGVIIFEAAESEMGKPRILEAIEEVQQEKKGHEKKLRVLQPKLHYLQQHENDLLEELSKEKEEQARLKREMLIMQGKLEDSDNRIQSIKQIHDQQNKKIKQIDQEKETLSKENRKWHYDISRDQFRYMKDTKSLIRQVETSGIDAARQSLNQRIKNAKRNRRLRPILERGDSDRMKSVANDGLTKLRRPNAINSESDQVLNISKSLDGLNDRSNGPDGRRQIPALSRSQHLPLNQM